ncbi:LysR family transcriptional regulator [Acetobacter conturbans]|uniref:LysR family transcriptional regulator n=1 Tax=Acetobacter conturbans TaxID=1737472 RepID=A0ABX0JV81_9PROT|nr:LysR family transcriptional regulator [Acetobacter conturbans]NHN87131.1 LysR family transcriptional regulator [Acetobacter conturbans]
MDRIDLFRVFMRVVETESFSRAAASLNLPRSTVSTAVRQLEARVGARLLARTTRSVTPTVDGRAFYEHVSPLVADVEETEGLFRRDREAPRGVLRVDMPGRIGRLIVAPALPGFLERYPGIEVVLGVTDRATNLVEDGIDCALRVGPLADSSLIARRLMDLEVINVASPAYLAAQGVPRGPEDLPHHRAVRYASPATGRIEEWEWMQRGEVRGCRMGARVTVNSAEALIACCLAGLGMIQVPAYDVRRDLAGGALVEVMPEWRAEALPLTVLYPERRHVSARLRVFVEWLVAVLEREMRV